MILNGSRTIGRASKRLLVAAVAMVLPAGVGAQLCLGLPSSVNRARVTAGVSMADSSQAVSASLGGATARGIFGDLGVGRITYDGIAGATAFGFATIGGRVSPAAWRVQACPVAGVSHGVGPKGFSGTGTDVSINGASAGIAIGMPLRLPVGGLVVLPNGTLSAQYAQTKVTFSGTSQSASATSGLADLGIALTWGDRVSIQPAIQVPFASDDRTRTVSITASVALLRR